MLSPIENRIQNIKNYLTDSPELFGKRVEDVQRLLEHVEQLKSKINGLQEELEDQIDRFRHATGTD